MMFKALYGAAALWSLMVVAATHRDDVPEQASPQVTADAFNDRWMEPRQAAPQAAAVSPPKELPRMRERKHRHVTHHCQRRYHYRGHHKHWRCRR